MEKISCGMILLTFTMCVACLGDARTLTIDPIQTHHSGEPFTISGTKSEDTAQIGIEVFPTRYWEYACQFGKQARAKYFRFVLQYLSETLNNAPYVKLVRFNPDKTQSYIEYPRCPDHILAHPSVPGGPGNTRWSVPMGDPGQGRPLQPGSYVILVWDASGQILYSDTYQPNGWDISGEYVYPATMRGNVWDLENRQECANRVFSIK
ncbi:MAG: hypothetical protein V1862_02865 [Methanobacteriota archaeon]